MKLVVGTEPADEIEDLLGAEGWPGVGEQCPGIAGVGAHVFVELEALRPAFLQHEGPEAEALDQEPKDPVREGTQLVGAARRGA